jgi:hypothetical protein
VNGYEFVISATVAASGLFAVFSWNAVFPDKRDCLILGPLPIRTRTLIFARLAAIGTALAGIVVAVDFFTGLAFSFTAAESLAGVARAFGVWWIAMMAAGIFTYCAVLCLQGVASQILTWRLFLRISGPLQLIALFAVLALLFLTPPFSLTMRHASGPGGGRLMELFPSYWFTGLLLRMMGNREPRFSPLAGIALRNLLLAVTASAVLYAAAWLRNVRRIAEAPDIAPSIRKFGGQFWKLPGKPLDRAIVLFTLRTIARSRQHRLLLAAYGGMGFALALAFSGSFLMGTSHERPDQPNVPLMTAGLLVLSVSVAGTRAIFGLPQTLPANWILRITAVHSPREYFLATRRALLLLAAVPVWTAAAVAYFSLWPARSALQHMLVLVLAGTLFADLTLYRFRKIPFACSWLPGGAQFRIKLGIWMLIFVIFAGTMTAVEFSAMHSALRFGGFVFCLGAAAVWAARRNFAFAASPANRLIFDEIPENEIFSLGLGDESYRAY